jgi:type VI secretion system protein ImpG
VPLRPSALSGGAGTSELEHEGQGPTRKTRLTLNQPGAFSKPVRVAMEAWWYQPLSPDAQPSSYRVGLAERFLEGLAWSTVGAIIPSRDSRLEHDSQGLLQLLSIRNQRFLQLEDLGFLLDALGVNDERYFRPVAERLSSVEVRSMPFAKSATGFKYLYQLTLSELAPLLVPTLDLFAARLLELLRAWSTEEVVELEVKLPHLDQELHYPAREAAQ